MEVSDGTVTNYVYDVDGTRRNKTVGGVAHYYIWEDGRPLKEYVAGKTSIYNAADTMYFFYDQNGAPYALMYNNVTYYYILNVQGDVIRLVDSTGATVASYVYDPYGNMVSATGAMAQKNPLRYRGYYYDQETGFYYLNARYYDPKVGRFLNADAVECLGVNGDTSSYNLFAYCGNNPVNREDVAGAFWETAFDVVTLCASITDVVMNPDDPWAWAGAAGDLVDLVPFVVGVGELIKAAKMGKMASKSTGTVWDCIKATQDFYPNSSIPKSFEIEVKGQRLWVHGNATEHIYQDFYAKVIGGKSTAYTNLYTQELMNVFYGSLELAMGSGIKYGEVISAGNWEFIFAQPRQAGLLPVIKHAQFNG